MEGSASSGYGEDVPLYHFLVQKKEQIADCSGSFLILAGSLCLNEK